jgi:hypothetical protein
VGIARYISLMFFIDLSTIWATQHDYGNICNSYVVYLYSMILWYDILLYSV